jgi:hypothetical protein
MSTVELLYTVQIQEQHIILTKDAHPDDFRIPVTHHPLSARTHIHGITPPPPPPSLSTVKSAYSSSRPLSSNRRNNEPVIIKRNITHRPRRNTPPTIASPRPRPSDPGSALLRPHPERRETGRTRSPYRHIASAGNSHHQLSKKNPSNYK